MNVSARHLKLGPGPRRYTRYITKLLPVAQDYYPEMLVKIFMVNSPFIFRATWAIISPVSLSDAPSDDAPDGLWPAG